MDTNRFIELLESYLQNRADEDDQNELFLMIASGKYDAEISKRINSSFEEEGLIEMDLAKARKVIEYITGGEKGHKEHEADTKDTRVVPMRRRWIKWAAAACIILLAGIATYTVISKRSGKSPATTIANAHDVPAPSNTRAVITLADGSKVYLDSVNNGTIAQQNNVSVVKSENGAISYQPLAISKGEVAYNTLFNPRGSKVISLTLSDGTKVWLNSESSLKYPTAFNSNTREVEITGEAYFEVKHNAKQPFKVHLPNGSVVEDIGTSFNVNAYSDEDAIRTTLIEGSIAVSLSPAKTEAIRRILKPGEQAVVTLRQAQGDNRILVNPFTDLDEVTAWKNGQFEFGGNGVEATMRQLSRWYDVNIVYEGPKPVANFRGNISRQENIAEVLKMLELTKAVKFRIEGRKVIVMK